MYIMVLEKVVSRLPQARPFLSMSCMYLQLAEIGNNGRTGSNALCSGLVLGKGTVKTL
jgi:hypothetical protein